MSCFFDSQGTILLIVDYHAAARGGWGEPRAHPLAYVLIHPCFAGFFKAETAWTCRQHQQAVLPTGDAGRRPTIVTPTELSGRHTVTCCRSTGTTTLCWTTGRCPCGFLTVTAASTPSATTFSSPVRRMHAPKPPSGVYRVSQEHGPLLFL